MQPKKPRFNPLILALALAAVLMVWSVLGGGSSSGERLTMNRTNTIRTATTRMPLNFGCFCFKKSTPIRCAHRAFYHSPEYTSGLRTPT